MGTAYSVLKTEISVTVKESPANGTKFFSVKMVAEVDSQMMSKFLECPAPSESFLFIHDGEVKTYFFPASKNRGVSAS